MLRSDTINTLLNAVDVLTVPRRTTVCQDIVDGCGKSIGVQQFRLLRPALLTQLDDAISSSLGGKTRGATLASERSILNADALYKKILIESQIGHWCHTVDVKRTGNAAANLRSWYVAVTANRLPKEEEGFYVRQLSKWAVTIRGVLDPWREKDLPDPCPACSATQWWDKRTGAMFLRPLIVRYRPDGADMISRSHASCRACEKVWNVRELAWEIEHADPEQHADLAEQSL